MEFKQLQSFVEVVRNLSFTKASQELYISQPTVSMHIRQLESELGVRLIVRTTKSLEVTETGRRLYEYAVNILTMRDRMVANCSLQNRHILSLGASTIPSAYLLPKLLPAFAEKYPESYFVIHQSDSAGVTEGLIDGTYDLGIIGMQPAQDTLVSEHLCSDRTHSGSCSPSLSSCGNPAAGAARRPTRSCFMRASMKKISRSRPARMTRKPSKTWLPEVSAYR